MLGKLPWKVIGPLVLMGLLYLCWSERVAGNARADAYQASLKSLSAMVIAQEKANVEKAKQSEEYIEHLEGQIASVQAAQESQHQTVRRNLAKLRTELVGEQRIALDSADVAHTMLVANHTLEVGNLRAIITERTQQRDDALEQVASLKRLNEGLKTTLAAESKRSGSDVWKVATGVASVVAIVAVAKR